MESSQTLSCQSMACPPVTEVVFSLTFEPVRFLLVDYGKLAKHFQELYPGVSDHNLTLELTSADGNTVLRISSTSFDWHWRRLNSDPVVYPGHCELLESYSRDLRALNGILSLLGKDELKPQLLALAYLNQVPVSEDGSYGQLLTTIFPDIHWRIDAERRLGSPVGINWQTVFIPKDHSGLLVAELKAPALAAAGPWNGSNVIQFDFVARGQAQGKTSPGEIQAWFGQAHEWVLDSFLDLTSQEYRRQNWEPSEKGTDSCH